jgi:predicted porin
MVEGSFRFGTGGVLVEYAMAPGFGQTETTVRDGNRLGFMGDFAFGPVTVTGAYSTMKDQATGTLTTKTTNFGGKYGMGALTFRAGWSKQDAEGGTDQTMFLLGVQYAISPTIDGRLGYYNTKYETHATSAELGTDKLFIAALDFSLSKQTTLYVEVDRYGTTLSRKATAATTAGARNDGSTGIGAGIVHAF